MNRMMGVDSARRAARRLAAAVRVVRPRRRRLVGRRRVRPTSVAARVVLAGVLAGLLGAASTLPQSARAQGVGCYSQPYHHLGCDDKSGPDWGKWSWNPGAASQWPGKGVSGDMHWWVQFGWYDAARFAAVRARNGKQPGLEFEYYNPGRHCGCVVDVLKVRLHYHRNAPQANVLEATARRGDCGASVWKSLMKVRFKSTTWITRGKGYDLSVDAQSGPIPRTGGEANLSWEGDGTAVPVGGCLPGNPRAEVWLGKVEFCYGGWLRAADPAGICCSTGQVVPLCSWQVCE
jgi:hypothetical protein